MASTDASVTKRVIRELQSIQKEPAEGIRLIVNEANITEVQAEIDGPDGTPYEGGVFRVRLSIPSAYPSSPPQGWFSTKIFHPNVGPGGEICVNVLKKDWTPDLGIRHVLVVIKCLLVHTNPESALNEEAGRLLLTDYEEFARHARLMTGIHAQRRPGPLTASNANTQSNPTAHEAGSDKQGGNTSPATKKAKAEQAGAQAGAQTAAAKPAAAAAAGKIKKSLKRL